MDTFSSLDVCYSQTYISSVGNSVRAKMMMGGQADISHLDESMRIIIIIIRYLGTLPPSDARLDGRTWSRRDVT